MLKGCPVPPVGKISAIPIGIGIAGDMRLDGGIDDERIRFCYFGNGSESAVIVVRYGVSIQPGGDVIEVIGGIAVVP